MRFWEFALVWIGAFVSALIFFDIALRKSRRK